MFKSSTTTVTHLQHTARRAFADFDAAAALKFQPPMPAGPSPRSRLAASLKTAAEDPVSKFDAATATLNQAVSAVAAGWEALVSDAKAWRNVAASLRGEAVVITEPALIAAVEVVKQSASAASLAREIESVIDPLIASIEASRDRHVPATKVAQRVAVNKHGERLHAGLGNERLARAHGLRLERARLENQKRLGQKIGIGAMR